MDGRNNRNSSLIAAGGVTFVRQSSGSQPSFGTLPHGAISMLGQGFFGNMDGRNNRNSSIRAVECVKFVHQSSGLQISLGTLPHGAISMLGHGFLQNGWKK